MSATFSNRYAPDQDWQGGPPGEREQANREAPIRLTDSQRERLRLLLIDELGGPVSAKVVLDRIEKEV